MTDQESHVPVAVALRAIQLAQESPRSGVCILELVGRSEPSTLLHARLNSASIDSFQDLVRRLALGEDDLQRLFIGNCSVTTPLADVSAETLASAESGYSIWKYVFHEPKASSAVAQFDVRSPEGESSVHSIAAASWMSVFVHAICQPLHVLKNVTELIQLKVDSGRISGEAMPRFLEMLSRASRDAEEKVEAVKSQFAQLDDHQSSCSVKDQMEAFFAEDSNIEVVWNAEALTMDGASLRLNMLFECMRGLVEQSSALARQGATSGSVSVDSDGTVMRMRLSLPQEICVYSDVLAASNSALLATAIIHAARQATDALFGTVTLLDKSQSGARNVMFEGGRAEVDTIAFEIPTDQNADSVKIARTVRRAW